MAYDAVFALLASSILNSKAATNVQPDQTIQHPHQAIIVGPIPAAVRVTEPMSFTAALSGAMPGMSADCTCDGNGVLGTADGAQPKEALDLESMPVEASGASRVLTGGVEFVVPALAYSNIPDTYLDATQPIDRVAALVSSNEGKPTSIDWNDNGKGVSVGLFQANQRVGELPDLLHELSTMPGGQEEIVGSLGPAFAQQVVDNPDVVRRLRFSPKNALGKGLCKLVHSQLFQKLQVAVLRRKVARAAEMAADYGITSSAGVAVCADLANQWGWAGARRFLQAADSMRSEGGKVKAVVNAVCRYSPYDSRYQCDLEKIEGNSLSYSDTFYATNVASQAYQN